MASLIPRRSRVWWVRSVDVLFWTVAAAAAPVLYEWFAPSTLGPWITIGTPVLIAGVGGLIKSFVTRIPELEWDQAGFQYRASEPIQVKWSEYRGHRLSWALPPGLKLFRAGKRPVSIDLFMFDEDQRSALLNELARHEVALPNKRLKLTARVD